tara:strand:- start:414 stop:812 length:399 start_codon:yes stop_codon:yes gene_type:complete
MKVNFKEQDDRLMVSVTIEGRSMARDPHTSVRTEQVLDIVREKGYNVSDYVVERDTACTTEGKNPTLSSTWILRKVKNEKQPVKSAKQTGKPKSTRTRAPRKKAAPKKDQLLGTEDLGGVQSQAQTDLPGPD